MPREDAIKIEGKVVEVLSNMLFRVELINGHQVMAHTARRLGASFEHTAIGDNVVMEMSPYDLSKGRITLDKIYES